MRARAVAGGIVVLLAVASGSGAVEVEVFTREACPRCAAAKAFLAELIAARPSVVVVERDLDRDPAALDRLRAVATAHGAAALGVPTFVVGERMIVGFQDAETTGRAIAEALDARPAGTVVVPILGALEVERLGLVLFTLAVGLVDGLNPCAMWVLLFILALLALYNVAYVFDDAVVVTIAVVTLSRHKLQERAGRWLKLLSGVVMLGLGTALLVDSRWLAR